MSLATDLRTQLVQLADDARRRSAAADNRADQRTAFFYAGKLEAFKTMIQVVELAAAMEPMPPEIGRPPKRRAS